MSTYILEVHSKAREFIDKLDKTRRARVDRYFYLFKEYGALLPGNYLKKIAKNIWELRPGDIRLFLTIRGNRGIVVHGIYKKTQKTPKKDLELSKKRIREEVE